MDFDIRKARRMYARSNKRKLTAQWSRYLAKIYCSYNKGNVCSPMNDE